MHGTEQCLRAQLLSGSPLPPANSALALNAQLLSVSDAETERYAALALANLACDVNNRSHTPTLPHSHTRTRPGSETRTHTRTRTCS
eukprot:2769814-Rhodomonas_salina.1